MSDSEGHPFFDLDNLDLEGDCDDGPLDWLVLDEEGLGDSLEAVSALDPAAVLPLPSDEVPPEKCKSPARVEGSIAESSSAVAESLDDAKTASLCQNSHIASHSNDDQSSTSGEPTKLVTSNVPPAEKSSVEGDGCKTAKKPWGPLCKRKNRGLVDQEPSSSEPVLDDLDDDDDVSSEDVSPTKLLDACLRPVVLLERIDSSKCMSSDGEGSPHVGNSLHEEDCGSSGKGDLRHESGGSSAELESSLDGKCAVKTSPSSHDSNASNAHKAKPSGSLGEKSSPSVPKPQEKSSGTGSHPNEKSNKSGESFSKTSEHSKEGPSSGKHSSHSHSHKHSHKLGHHRDGRRNSEASEHHSHRERTLSVGAKNDSHPSPTRRDSVNLKDTAAVTGKSEASNHQKTSPHGSKHDHRPESLSHPSPQKDKPSHGKQTKDEAQPNRNDPLQSFTNYHVPKLDRKDSNEGKKGKGQEGKKKHDEMDFIKSLYEPPKVQSAQAAKEAAAKVIPPQTKRVEEKDVRSPQLRRLEKLITSNVWGFELFDEETLSRSKTPGGPPQWLMSISQLTPDDLSQDEVQNLITLSVSSQWVSSKTSGRRYGKLTLLFDNTKSMKVAMKSLLQIRPGTKMQKISLLRSRTKEKDAHTKDLVEFQLLASGDTDISSETVCVEPSINHGYWKGKVNAATLMIENVPSSLEREVQADILQVLFPFAYIIHVSAPSKDSTGCNAILKHRREESVLAHVNMMRNIYILGRMQKIRPLGKPAPYHPAESRERRRSDTQDSRHTPQTPGESRGAHGTPGPSTTTTTTPAATATATTPSPSEEETKVAVLLLMRSKETLEREVQELMRLQGSEAVLPPTPVTATTLADTRLQLLSQVEDLIKMKEVMELMTRGDVLKQLGQNLLPGDSHLQSHLSQMIAQGGRAAASSARSTESAVPGEAGGGQEEPSQPLGDFESLIQTSAASSFIPSFAVGKQEAMEEGETESAGEGVDVGARDRTSGGQEASAQGIQSQSQQVPPTGPVKMENQRKRKFDPSNEPAHKHSRWSDDENGSRRNSGLKQEFAGSRASPAASPGQARRPPLSIQRDMPQLKGSGLPEDRERFGKQRHASPSPRDLDRGSKGFYRDGGRRPEPREGPRPESLRDTGPPEWWPDAEAHRIRSRDVGRPARQEQQPEPRAPLLRDPGHPAAARLEPLASDFPSAPPRGEPWFEERRHEEGLEYLRRSRSVERVVRDPYHQENFDRSPRHDLRAEELRDRTSQGRDYQYVDRPRSRPREDRFPQDAEEVMVEHLSERPRLSQFAPPVSEGRDLRNFVHPDDRRSHSPLNVPRSVDHHRASRSPEYLDRRTPVDERGRARFPARELRDFERPPEYDPIRYPAAEEFPRGSRERQPRPRSRHESEERDLPPRGRPEGGRRPPRRALLPGGPVDTEHPRREAFEPSQPPLLPLPQDPEAPWPEARPDSDPWRRQHPDDYGEEHPGYEQAAHQVQEYDQDVHPDPWEEHHREQLPPRRERRQGRERAPPRPAPPPGGLLGHAPPDHALEGAPPSEGLLGHAPPEQAFEAAPPPGLLGHAPPDQPPRDYLPEEPDWQCKPGLLGPPPPELESGPREGDRPALEHRRPHRGPNRPPREVPREAPREGLLGEGPEQYEADLPSQRRPGPGLLGEAPPEASYPPEEHRPRPWYDDDNFLSEAVLPPPRDYEPEPRPPPPPVPPRRPRERTPVEAPPPDSYNYDLPPPRPRRPGKVRPGPSRPQAAYEYEQEPLPPPPSCHGPGLLGPAPPEAGPVEEHPVRWAGDGLLGRAPPDAYGHGAGDGMGWEGAEEHREHFQEAPPQWEEEEQRRMSSSARRGKRRPVPGRGGERLPPPPPPQRGPPLLATPPENPPYDEQQYRW